jgi:glycosyltransferase involved in cell wall biosynthesis
LALAKHLDKEKFNCFALELYSGQLQSQKGIIPGLRVFNCFRPARISLYLGFLWGIWHCDVAYLPKRELWKWNRFLLQLLRKKSFSTLEGIIDETAMNNAIISLGGSDNYIKSRSYFDKQYSITNYMKNYNYQKIGLQTEGKTLYLGVDSAVFNMQSAKTVMSKVLMIGNDLLRKGLFDYLKVAANFPEITFYIAGSGNGKVDVNSEIEATAV